MFKLTCGKCGSINVFEISGEKILERKSDRVIFGKGIHRTCTECDNEDFVIFKTWVQKD